MKSLGSSPRARGTPLIRALDRQRERFIPACAGNTKAEMDVGAVVSVHPRVRGEHASPDATAVSAHGSSPRARGTRRV